MNPITITLQGRPALDEVEERLCSGALTDMLVFSVGKTVHLRCCPGSGCASLALHILLQRINAAGFEVAYIDEGLGSVPNRNADRLGVNKV